MTIKFTGNPKDVIYNKKILLALFEELTTVSNIIQGFNEGAFNDMEPEILKEEKEAFNFRQQYLIDQILDYMYLPRHIINEYSDIYEMMNDLFDIPYWMRSLEEKIEEYINYITKEHCCKICGSEVSIGEKYCSDCVNGERNLATVFNDIANSIRNIAIPFPYEEAVVHTNPCREIILPSDDHREVDREIERPTNELIYAELTEDDLRGLAHSLFGSYG